MNHFRNLRLTLINLRIMSCFTSKPRLFLKVLKRYFKSYINNQSSLRFMDISLGYTCNFDCQHCSASILDRPDDELLSLAEYGTIAQSAIEAGVLAFHFTGGEPLIQKNLFKIIACFRPQESLISIQTNGWLVDEEFLKKYKNIGGDIICVSVDSADPQIHDKFRNRNGSWDKAIGALTSAREKGFQTLMSYTVTHTNIMSKDFRDMIHLAKKLGSTLSLNLAVPAGKWAGQYDFLLTGQDRQVLNTHLSENPHVRTDFESNWRVRGCPAFKEKCYLTPYGDILPCPFIHISFGNVRFESIADIRRRALSYQYMNKYHSVCIAAEDRFFIQNAGCYCPEASQLPIPSSASPLFQLLKGEVR